LLAQRRFTLSSPFSPATPLTPFSRRYAFADFRHADATPLCRHYLRRRFATAASLHAACRYRLIVFALCHAFRLQRHALIFR
jgi:hypothetical protein